MTATNEANGWYGGTLLGDQDESSEIYRHYAELIQVQICATLSVVMLCYILVRGNVLLVKSLKCFRFSQSKLD